LLVGAVRQDDLRAGKVDGVLRGDESLYDARSGRLPRGLSLRGGSRGNECDEKKKKESDG
jgi:hypothetical protein